MIKDLGRVVGKSAYEIACDNGFVGTEQEWLESLDGSNYDDTEIKELINETKDLIEPTVNNAISEIIANAPEDLNTLKEIADWIDTHEDSASAMNTAIQENKNILKNKSNYHTTSMVDLGFASKSYVSVREFWNKLYETYGNNGVIQFTWSDANASYVGTTDTNVFMNGGTLIYTSNGKPINKWRSFSAIFVQGHANGVYQIRCSIGDDLTEGNESWIVLRLANIVNLNDYAKKNDLNGLAVSGHTHDDRYYTESEIDTKLDNKANSSNTRYKTTKQFYGTRKGRYVKIGSIPISSGSVSFVALDIVIFALSSVGNFPVGIVELGMSSGSSATGFNINGYSSIPLNNTDNTNHPKIVVEKTSSDYVLYIDCNYSYLGFSITEGDTRNYTRGDFEENSTLSGTIVYNSTSNNQIKYLEDFALKSDLSSYATTTELNKKQDKGTTLSTLYNYSDNKIRYYWYKILNGSDFANSKYTKLKITTSSDENYAYDAEYVLDVGYYASTTNKCLSVGLANLYKSNLNQANLCIAIDKDFNIYLQAKCEWSSYAFIEKVAGNVDFITTRLNYIEFKTDPSDFVSVKKITDTENCRLLKNLSTNEITITSGSNYIQAIATKSVADKDGNDITTTYATKAELEEIKKKNDELEEENEILVSENLSLNSSILTLNDQISRLTSQNNILSSQNSSLSMENAQLENEIIGLNNTISNQQTTISQLEAYIRQLESQLQWGN